MPTTHTPPSASSRRYPHLSNESATHSTARYLAFICDLPVILHTHLHFLQTFIDAYNQKHGPGHALTKINIANPKCARLATPRLTSHLVFHRGQPYADSVLLSSAFQDRDDVHIQRSGPVAGDSVTLIVFDHTLFPKPPRRGQFTLPKTCVF